MAINVPVNVDVSGLPSLEALDETLDDVARPRTGEVGLDTTPALAAAASLDKLLDEATETREADVNIDVNGLNNLDKLRESLNLTKERAEVAALEKALDQVAKLRQANVDVEGTKEGQAKLRALDKALKAVERRRTVEVDVDEPSIKRTVETASQAGGAISEAFSGAFQLVAKNAILLGVVVTAAFAALPVIGAVAATGLVLAFGSGIAGIGILAAAQSEEVQKAFKDMAQNIVGDLKEMAIPLESTLLSISEFVQRTFDTFAPALNDSIAQMAPVLTVFANSFLRAFERLEPAIEPLTDAFTDLLDAIGPRLDGFFGNLSDSITRLSETISADPDLFAGLFVGLLNTLPLVINVVTDLAQAFQMISDTVGANLGPAIAALRDQLEPITAAFSEATGGISLFQFGLGVLVTSVTVVAVALAATLRILTATIQIVRRTGKAIADTWRNTRVVTANAWASIRNTVSRATQAVRAAIQRGMDSARAVVSSVMARIRGVFSSAWAAIRGVVSGGVSRVRGAVASLSGIIGTITGIWSRVRGAFSRGISSAVSLVRGLPGRVRGAMGSLGSVLFSSGVSLINGFASGIRAAIGNAVSAASEAVGAVRDFFPFSPAKKGPFSGTGYTTYSGEALVKDWADAIDKTASQVTPDVAAALDPMANAFATPSLATGTAPSGTTSDPAGGFSMDALVAALAAMFARLQLQVTLGRDRRTTAEWWLDGQRLAGDLS